MPERTLKIGKWYMPVCARCTGLYIGVFSYYAYVYMVSVHYTPELIFMAVLISIPTFLDGLTQYLGYRESNNLLRLSTGLIGGLGFGILVKALKLVLIS